MFKLLSLFLVLALYSCAQNDKEKVKSSKVTATREENKSTTKQASALITWEAGGKKYTINRKILGGTNILLDKPFTVSKEIPNALEITLQGITMLQDIQSLEIRAKISNAEESSKATPAVILAVEVAGSSVSITGIRSYFVSQNESRGMLTLDFIEKTTGKSKGSFSMEIHTLNSKVEISRVSPQDFPYKQLNSHFARYDLLQLINVKNNGNEKIEFKYGSHLPGYLFRDFQQYGYKQLKCKCETWQNSWQDQYQTDLRILPIGNEIFTDWTKLISNEFFLLALDPGEEISLGLYGMGENLRSFVDQGVSNSAHGKVEVIVGCDSPDPNDRRGPKKDFHFVANLTPIYDFVAYGIDVEGVYLHSSEGNLSFGIRNGSLDEKEDPVSYTLQFSMENRRVF